MFLDKFLILILILIFCLHTFQYIYQRYKEKKLLLLRRNNDNYDYDDNNTFNYDLDNWINNNDNLIQRDDDFTVANIENKSLCKGIVIEINNNKENCNDISQNLCDGKYLLRKITVPINSKIDFYSHSGYKLTKGQSYCIYKPPPPLLSNDSHNKCNETWGFWKYSLKYEMWQCKSKVPGIYNANKNVFDPCKKGYLYHKGSFLPNRLIPEQFSPEQFYTLDFQRKFYCDCPRGYISRPELSRTTCFRDPCLINLPLNAEAAGYDIRTGVCHCTPYFYNLYPGNLKSPCTMCPDAPIWDFYNNNLILYVKCGKEHKFKCLTEEDEIRGCIKTVLRVKVLDGNSNDQKFRNLVFF